MISVLQLSSQSVVEIIMLRGDPGRSVKGAPRAGVATAKEYFGHGHVWSDLRLILVGFVSGFWLDLELPDLSVAVSEL